VSTLRSSVTQADGDTEAVDAWIEEDFNAAWPEALQATGKPGAPVTRYLFIRLGMQQFPLEDDLEGDIAEISMPLNYGGDASLEEVEACAIVTSTSPTSPGIGRTTVRLLAAGCWLLAGGQSSTQIGHCLTSAYGLGTTRNHGA
jgi:hypothetical protein